MMETINISMPKQMAEQMDKIIKTEGYASRSELVRTLLRMYTYLKSSPQNSDIDFEVYTKRDINEIADKLRDSDLYSETFIKSVTTGLKKSSVYANKATKK